MKITKSRLKRIIREALADATATSAADPSAAAPTGEDLAASYEQIPEAAEKIVQRVKDSIEKEARAMEMDPTALMQAVSALLAEEE
jgi:cytochrome c551/c552